MRSLRFVSYLRVSTDRQGRSGLGLEAQRTSVMQHVRGAGEMLAEFVEVESGKRDDRPRLLEALNLCRITGATLIVAKFDRLSRNAAFLLTLRDAGVQFIAADMPDANEMTVGIMAILAQHERQAISDRTRAALAAKKARGEPLGRPENLSAEHRARGRLLGQVAVQAAADDYARMLAPYIARIRGHGIESLSGVARALNEMGVRTRRGGAWRAQTVRNLLERSEVCAPA